MPAPPPSELSGREVCYDCGGDAICPDCAEERQDHCLFCFGVGRCPVCDGAGTLPTGTWQAAIEKGWLKE